MTEKLDNKELVSFQETLMGNSIQVDALAQLLIEKGFPKHATRQGFREWR